MVQVLRDFSEITTNSVRNDAVGGTSAPLSAVMPGSDGVMFWRLVNAGGNRSDVVRKAVPGQFGVKRLGRKPQVARRVSEKHESLSLCVCVCKCV